VFFQIFLNIFQYPQCFNSALIHIIC